MGTLLEAALDYVRSGACPKLKPDFLERLEEAEGEHGELTEKQMQALRNIVKKWRIPLPDGVNIDGDDDDNGESEKKTARKRKRKTADEEDTPPPPPRQSRARVEKPKPKQRTIEDDEDDERLEQERANRTYVNDPRKPRVMYSEVISTPSPYSFVYTNESETVDMTHRPSKKAKKEQKEEKKETATEEDDDEALLATLNEMEQKKVVAKSPIPVPAPLSKPVSKPTPKPAPSPLPVSKPTTKPTPSKSSSSKPTTFSFVKKKSPITKEVESEEDALLAELEKLEGKKR